MKRLLAIMLLIGMLVLTGCGKETVSEDSTYSGIEGTWKMAGICVYSSEPLDPEITASIDDINELYDSGYAVQTMTLTGGKYTLDTVTGHIFSTSAGEYTIDGEQMTLTLTDSVERHIVRVNGDELIMIPVDETWEYGDPYAYSRFVRTDFDPNAGENPFDVSEDGTGIWADVKERLDSYPIQPERIDTDHDLPESMTTSIIYMGNLDYPRIFISGVDPDGVPHAEMYHYPVGTDVSGLIADILRDYTLLHANARPNEWLLISLDTVDGELIYVDTPESAQAMYEVLAGE